MKNNPPKQWSKEYREEIENRLKNITEGEWGIRLTKNNGYMENWLISTFHTETEDDQTHDLVLAEDLGKDDCIFLANAPTDLQSCLKRIQELEDQLNQQGHPQIQFKQKARLSCTTCQDTHRMYSSSLEREIPCTFCPLPCNACMNGAYCIETPCLCDCHKDSDQNQIHSSHIIRRDEMGSDRCIWCDTAQEILLEKECRGPDVKEEIRHIERRIEAMYQVFSRKLENK